MNSAIRFDRAEFTNVARAILALNKYAAGDTVENIVARMESIAYYYDPSAPSGAPGNAWNSYVATYGFVLTGYRMQDGTRGIKASVCASFFAA